MDDLKYGELLETVKNLRQDFEALKKENTRLVNMVNERFSYVKEAFDMITGRKRLVCKSEPMSENQLWTIEARAEAATPGPWVVELPEWGECNGIRSKNGTQILNAGTCIPDPQTAVDLGGTVHDWKEEPYDYGVHRWDDAAFIAAAREDVPALLAEVERLRAENARLERGADWLVKLLLDNGRGFSGINPCPVGITCLNFECPHKQLRTVLGCDGYEMECWRKAADMATRENPGEELKGHEQGN